MNTDKTKKYLILFFLSMGQGSVYFLPYIRNVYYTPMLETLNVTNAQFGALVSFFALGCMALYIPGGIMSDKLNYKKCITYSLYSTAILVGSFAFFLNYSYAKVVFTLLAVTTTFVFWSSVLKAVRIIGSSDNQGKTFGLYYAIQGLFSIISQNIFLIMYNSFADPVSGLKAVLIANAVVTLLAAIGCQIYLKESEAPKADSNTKQVGFEFKNVGKVVKNPLVWLIAVMIFCAYGVYSNSYFYSMYLVGNKGLDPKVGSQLSLIRVTYMMCIASYIGGIGADKLKSTSKFYIICSSIAAVFTVVFISLMNSNMNVMFLGIVSILPAAFMLMVYGITSSLYEEYNIPISYTGTAIGIVAILGYTPDLFFGTLLGGWLDKQGDAGYNTIFMFFAIVAVVGAVSAILGKMINDKRLNNKMNTSN